MINPAYLMSNRGGIPRLQSTGVDVGTAEVAFTFASDFTFTRNYSGLVLMRFAQEIPSGTTTTLPVVVKSSAGTQALTSLGGSAVTVAQIPGAGIVLAYYDRDAGTLQML